MLAQLAKRHDGRTLTRLEDLAQREAVSPSFLIQILSDLRRAGIVESRRGQAGGYLLARAPESITLSQAIDAIDPAVLHGSLSEDGESGPALRRTWEKISGSLREGLDRTTLENLIAQPGEGMFYI